MGFRPMNAVNVDYSRKHYPEMFEHKVLNAPSGWTVKAEKIYADNGVHPEEKYGHQFCPIGWQIMITNPSGEYRTEDVIWARTLEIANYSDPDYCFQVKWSLKIEGKKIKVAAFYQNRKEDFEIKNWAIDLEKKDRFAALDS